MATVDIPAEIRARIEQDKNHPLAKAIGAVLDIHKPYRVGDTSICQHCLCVDGKEIRRKPWPCLTIENVACELGVIESSVGRNYANATKVAKFECDDGCCTWPAWWDDRDQQWYDAVDNGVAAESILPETITVREKPEAGAR